MTENPSTVKRPSVFSGQRLFLLIALSIGHAIMHFCQQGYYILLPEIKRTFDLNPIQYGAIESTRSISGGVVNFPAGVVSDLLRERWVLIVGMALIGVGLAYLVLSIAPNYAIVLIGAGLVGVSTALWHPPALSVLSSRLAERRGLALAVHGMGGNLGNAVGPLALGVLVSTFALRYGPDIGWQRAAQVAAIPMILVAVLLFVALRNVRGREGRAVKVGQYAAAVKGLLRNKVLIGLIVSGGIRGMGMGSMFAFFPIYLREDLGFSSARLGFYLFLLMISGIVSQPVLGILSDRIGRKAVLVPSLILLGLFEMLLVWAGAGVGLMLVVMCVGLFIYSIGAIIQAAAMDVTTPETGAMTIALLFGSTFVLTTPSPMIAGFLASSFGTPSVFLYAGALVLLSALIVLWLPFRPVARASGEQTEGG